jgi:hypothetical protein
LGLLDRLASRPKTADAISGSHGRSAGTGTGADDPVIATRALRKFLTTLTAREAPTLLDLGPVVGTNVSFFGEQIGCKILVEDVYTDLERHARDGRLEDLPAFLAQRFKQPDASIDGVLLWDVIDYLDRDSAAALAEQMTRLLRAEGALLAFFATAPAKDTRYAKYVIVDDSNLKYRGYAPSRGRQAVLLNRDILRLFPDLRVSDSFLLQNNLRELLFRKPAYDVR